MPIATGSSGGSYYYPVMQAPASSYPSVDIRGNGVPNTVGGLGRLYVLSSSGDLYYKDPDGNQIVVASVGSGIGENVFENITVSGAADIRGVVRNEAGRLILSSSADGIALSGNLYTSTTNGPGIFDRASTSTVPTLIPRMSLTASGIGADTSGVVSIISNATEAIRIFNSSVNVQVAGINVWGSVNVLNSTGVNNTGLPRLIGLVASNTVPNVVSRSDHASTGMGAQAIGKISLIAASLEALRIEESGSSVMVLGTGSLILSGNTAGRTTISSQESHLILSSSAGSTVTLSSSLIFAASNATISASHIASRDGNLILSASSGKVTISGTLQIGGMPNNDATISQASNGVLTLVSSAGISLANAGTLGGSTWSLINNGTFTLVGQGAYIGNTSAHLILTSSVSSVAVSGGLKLYNATTASLAAPPKGTIMWDTNVNEAVVYNGVSWFRLSSGSAV